MTEIDKTGSEQPSGISRRTVNQAMAWSVPAVAMAASAPAFAASPGIFTLTGAGCKLPGNSQDVFKGYAFGVVVTNDFNSPLTITVTSLTLNGEDLGNILFIETAPTCTTLGENSFVIPANTSYNVVALTQNAASSSNGSLTVMYDYSGADSGSGTDTQSTDAAPPLQGSCEDETGTAGFTEAEITCVESQLALLP